MIKKRIQYDVSLAAYAKLCSLSKNSKLSKNLIVELLILRYNKSRIGVK